MKKSFTKSLIGPRKNNQDSLYFEDSNGITIAAIADGVGGNKCGEVASEIAIKSFVNFFRDSLGAIDLISIANQVHNSVLEYSKANPECQGMATTLTTCYITENIIHGFNVGDTRTVLLRGNGIKQLTVAHNEPYKLLKKGIINIREYNEHPKKNVLTSAIGSERELSVQKYEHDLLSGDRIILSSDGFHDVFDKKELRDISISCETLEKFNNTLVYEIGLKNLTDNCSFVLFEID